MFYGSDTHAQSAAAIFSTIRVLPPPRYRPSSTSTKSCGCFLYSPKDRYLELAPKHWLATRAMLNADELAAPLCSFTPEAHTMMRDAHQMTKEAHQIVRARAERDAREHEKSEIAGSLVEQAYLRAAENAAGASFTGTALHPRASELTRTAALSLKGDPRVLDVTLEANDSIRIWVDGSGFPNIPH